MSTPKEPEKRTEKEKRRNQQAPRVKGEIYTMLTIGDRLRYLLELRQMTQVALAEKIGLTQAAISNLITDETRKPSSATLMKIAAVLECNPTWILDGIGDPFAWAPVTNETEVELLKAFKALDDGGKAHLLATAQVLANKK